MPILRIRIFRFLFFFFLFFNNIRINIYYVYKKLGGWLRHHPLIVLFANDLFVVSAKLVY